MKYIVVTGGVVSGLGKGVTISSMGRLLKSCGLKVTAIKIDPYLNVDAGTMSPFEHGECFVLKDGGETDLDLGNYERFLDISLTQAHNLTTGKVYRHVILKERRGDYLGKTVQVVPHITNHIQEILQHVSQIPVDNDNSDDVADVCLIEVGGTVGDIESAVFLEALRQFQFQVGPSNFLLCFVSLVPIITSEQKTKPTQHGVKQLRSLGLSPSLVFCRSTEPLLEETKTKISNFCHVPASHVLSVHDVANIYHVPLLLQEQHLAGILQTQLDLPSIEPDFGDWKTMAHAMESFDETVEICLIGKYTGLQDSYLSVIKALKHAAIACRRNLNLVWVEATKLEDENDNKDDYTEAWNKVKSADGIIVPGGFGNRGFLGKVLAAHYCRIHEKPFLGVCLGFQAMVVEYARFVLNLPEAHSTEFDESTPHPVILHMPEISNTHMGGTMRLGLRTTTLDPDCLTSQLHKGETQIHERHRHRYEVNPEYVHRIHDAGLHFCGRDADTGERMEVAELPHHPYYVGVQYHPEFQSKPLQPSPTFHGLILAACQQLQDHLKK